MTMEKTCCFFAGLLAVGGLVAVAGDAPGAVVQKCDVGTGTKERLATALGRQDRPGLARRTSEKFPERDWQISDGELIVASCGGGDIITKEKFSDSS